MRGTAFFLVVVLGGVFVSPAAAEEPKWGDLKMRFVYDGEPPKPMPLQVRGGLPAPLDERWVVNPKNRGVANVLLYLDARADEAVSIHPELVKPAKDSVTINIVGNRFEPRVTLQRAEQKLVVANGDPFGHNVVVDFVNSESINELLLAGQSITRTLDQPLRGPAILHDAIHPHMLGWVMICDHPYASVSDRDGNVQISKLPVGKRLLRVWHEGRLMKGAMHGHKTVEWKCRLVEAEVKEEGTDLGVFAIK